MSKYELVLETKVSALDTEGEGLALGEVLMNFLLAVSDMPGVKGDFVISARTVPYEEESSGE